MSKSFKMEIFRGGKQTDSAGNSKEWTEADLDKIVSKTNALNEDVPFTIGHQKKDGPAWAWGKTIFREGNSIFTKMGDVTSELGIMLKKKMFKNRSIALRPDHSIRHIALLGAEPPAVKGLEAFAFAEKDVDFTTHSEIDFSENEFEDYDANFLKTLKRVLLGLNNPNFTEKPTEAEMSEITDLQDQVKKLTNQFAESETAHKTAIEAEAAKTAAAEKEFSDFKVGQRKGEINTWVESQVEAGKVLPANKEAVLNTCLAIDGNDAHDFSEGEKTVKKTPLDSYKESIEAKETEIEFDESFTGGQAREVTGSDKKITDLAKAMVKENKDMDFNEALEIVLAENPTLNQSIK